MFNLFKSKKTKRSSTSSPKYEQEISRKPDYVGLDFEYATSYKGSICSVGIASFKDGQLVDKFYSLVKPPNNEYNWVNTNINHISKLDTDRSPNYKQIFPEIKKRLHNNTVVAHGAYHTEKACLEQAMDFYGIFDNLKIKWECTQDKYDCSLNVACDVLGIELDHHNALSDAKACGYLYQIYLNGKIPYGKLQAAKTESKRNPAQSIYHERISGDVLKPDFENVENKDNPFYMKKVVITGFANGDTKKEMAQTLKKLGADIDTGVGKKTNFLIVGESPGPSKLKKMETLIEEGKEASIITYKKYLNMIK